MSQSFTQREVAVLILDVLVHGLGLKPGNPVPDQALKTEYRKRGGDSADIKIGLKYAADQEWLSYESSSDTWHLTELGHEYA